MTPTYSLDREPEVPTQVRLLYKSYMLTALGMVIMLSPVNAAIITGYTDSSLFSLVSPDMTAVDFSSNPCLSGFGSACSSSSSTGFVFGPADNQVRFTGTNGDGSSATYLKWAVSPLADFYLTSYIYSSDASRQLRIDLPNGGATAIALNLMSLFTPDFGSTYQTGADITVTTSGGTIGPITTQAWSSAMGGSPPPTWLGITSDVPMTTLSLKSTQGGVAVDAFRFGMAKTIADPAPADTPEISTMLMIGFGLLVFRAARRFRRIEA